MVGGRSPTGYGRGVPLTFLTGGARSGKSSIAVRRAERTGLPVVFVATGEKFADALSGGPIAVRSAAPVLLTRAGELPDETIAELQRITPQRIVILGGTTAVSADIQVELAAYLD